MTKNRTIQKQQRTRAGCRGTNRLTPTERLIIRNQRYIMLALAALCMNKGVPQGAYHANKLGQRVRDMEATFQWIASPSERL